MATLVYLNALDNPFVYDDFRLIVENSSITNVWDVQTIIVRDIKRPIVNISYALDTALWGRGPDGYHVTNLLLHVLNVVLVYWVAFLASEDRKRQVTQRLGVGVSSSLVGFGVAALFAVHPMLTQAVGYIASRSEVAYSAFFLLAFLAGRRWLLAGGRRWWITCVGLWVVAMLAKESAAMLSFVLLAYDGFVLDADRPTRRARFMKLGLPLLAITLAAGAGRVAVLLLVEYSDQARTDWRYGLVVVDAFWQYLGLFFFPRGQSIFHAVSFPGALRGVACVAGLVGFVALAWWLRRIHSLIGLGLVWFALLLVPSSILFVLGRGEPMAEHRAYLASVGLFLTWSWAFAALWARPARPRLVLGAVAAAFLAQLAFQTIIRNAVWHDPVLLSREAAAMAPQHWMPRILLAEALRQGGRCMEAVPEYRMAIAMRPQDEFPYTKLAGCLIEARRLDEAAETMRQLRSVNPGSHDALMGLGIFTLLGGNTDESRAHFQDVVAREPDRPRAQLMLDFIDGKLVTAEHQKVCAELEMIAGAPLPIAQCGGHAHKDDGNAAVTSQN